MYDHSRDWPDAPEFERNPRRRSRDRKRDPRVIQRDRTRKLARQAKHAMQGRER